MSKTMQFKARIRNISKESQVSAQAILQNYMLERLLERISLSGYKDKFVLKGGMLIASLVGIDYRTTMDMDATLRDYPLSEKAVQQVLLEICTIDLQDEVIFTLEDIEAIRDHDTYGGYRAALAAQFESIRTPLKIDITTGDMLTPNAILYTFPSSFDEKEIEIWAYNLETIFAEKVETILRRSVLNTRARDFYDVYILIKAQGEALDHSVFKTALSATMKHRDSLEVLQDRAKILRAIQADTFMLQRWERYSREYYYAREINFNEIIRVLIDILS
jgi:predicted nucleotidyltransferase component of viral defense system